MVLGGSSGVALGGSGVVLGLFSVFLSGSGWFWEFWVLGWFVGCSGVVLRWF